ncbi:MAG: GGDEF domain-containing protein [Arcobacter sp.]|nr:GGDEF domain-containing protein [Arcobacter sp.]
MFCEFENYINTKYLEKDKITNNINLGKEFFKLVNNTDESKRIVIICNTKLEEKSFYINISSIDSKKGLYLIGLMDITKITIDKLQIENIAYTDGLTGVANRNKFELTFEDELSRTKRYKNPLSIAILDIDNFKNFNDKYGHLIGDEVLIMIAKECELQLRASDTFARWGGEEFILILPQTKLERAIIVIEKIRNIIKNKKHKTAGFITCSFGVTEYKEKDNLKSIFKRCDKALYQAKFNGRDRVEYIK